MNLFKLISLKQSFNDEDILIYKTLGFEAIPNFGYRENDDEDWRIKEDIEIEINTIDDLYKIADLTKNQIIVDFEVNSIRIYNDYNEG